MITIFEISHSFISIKKLRLILNIRFFLFFLIFSLFNLNAFSQDTIQWYWNHAFGMNNNYMAIDDLPSQAKIKQPGFNLISNWKRVSPKNWILSLGVNFKQERSKSEKNVLINWSSSTYRDTIGYYVYHFNKSFYYLNFGYGKRFILNEKWRFDCLLDVYFGGIEKVKEYQINFFAQNGTRNRISQNYNEDDLLAELFMGGSVEISFYRHLKKRSYLFLGLRYDGKLNSFWDNKLATYLNASFGISTLLLADKNGFPYRKKMKAKSVEASKISNAIIVELLGAGLVYSINYERSLITKKKYNLLGRVGFSFWDETAMLNFGFSNAFGLKNTRFETGVYYNQGLYKNWDGKTGYEYLIFPFMGIRNHKKNHYLSRIGLSPFLDFKSGDWFLSGYVSFGYRF